MSLILNGTDGSVSAPAVQGGTGGATTGVFYPASNQVALAANGIQALTINSLGYVQVGPAPAINRIYGSSGNPLYGLVDDVITISTTTDTTNHRVGIAFGPAQRIGSGIFANNISSTAGNEDTNLEFYVTQEGNLNSTLAMTLDQTGTAFINGRIYGAGVTSTNQGSNSYVISSFGVLGYIGTSGTGALTTTVPINQGNAGASMLLQVSSNGAAGSSTREAIYCVQFYYDGSFTPTARYINGSHDYITFGQSGGYLTLTSGYAGNHVYSWWINKS
jgi:hypothetical protein